MLHLYCPELHHSSLLSIKVMYADLSLAIVIQFLQNKFTSINISKIKICIYHKDEF